MNDAAAFPAPASHAPLFTASQTVRMSMLALAFLLPALSWEEAAGGALLALLFIIFMLPQLGAGAAVAPQAHDIRLKVLLRAHEGERPVLILYASSLFLLTLIYRHRLEVVAAAWALISLGPPAATLAARVFHSRALPWNPRKTWAGSLGFVLSGVVGAFTLWRWLNPERSAGSTLLVAGLAALLAAAVESTPIGLSSDVTVPWVCGGFLFCVSFVERSAFDSNLPFLPRRLLLALAVNLAFALMALTSKAASRSGTALGFVLGVSVYLTWGWKSFLVLQAFFILGSAATRLGYARKAARGIAETGGGARGWRQALANVAPGAFFGILAILTLHERAFLIAFVAAFAEAAGDTVSSEIGQWLSPRAYLITSWRPGAAGEDGGLSAAGSLAGFAASALIAGVAFGLGLTSTGGAALALGAAVAGNLVDSLLGATLERLGLVTNGVVNFAGTSISGALALALALR